MQNKVYVVTVSWENLASYEDYESNWNEFIGVYSSYEKANKKIQECIENIKLKIRQKPCGTYVIEDLTGDRKMNKEKYTKMIGIICTGTSFDDMDSGYHMYRIIETFIND